MKVRELIEKLQQFDQDATVVVGLEAGGYEDATEVRAFHIQRSFYD